MDIVTIDFETFYDRAFSLSKLTTEEYVRSPLFEIIGVSVKINDAPAVWAAGFLRVAALLAAIDFTDKAILCHNTVFDGAILSWRFGVKPRLWLDTLSMARPAHAVTAGGSLKKLALFYGIGEKGDEIINALGKHLVDFTTDELARYGAYCINDNDLTKKLFDILKKGFPVSELMVIDQTLRMYTEPHIVLDKVVLQTHLDAEKARKADLLERLAARGISKEQVLKIMNSNVQFAKLLKRCGIAPPMKTSKATGKLTFAFSKTDQEFTALLEHDDERVVALVETRLGTKSTIEETRTQRLLEVSERGPLPIMLNYYGAHTGRFSGGDKLNLQNLPSRKNNAIRRAICAPEGKVLIACDSAQIEARVVAWLANQSDLVEAFRQGRDIYSEFASAIYGYKVTKAQVLERFVGKTSVLGLGYGMGPPKFQDTLASGLMGMVVKLELDEAKRVVYLYRNRNHRIAALWESCDYMLKSMMAGNAGVLAEKISYDAKGIILPNKMRLTYHGLTMRRDGMAYIADQRSWVKYIGQKVSGTSPDDLPWSYIYGGKVTENIVQALARIVVAEQMVIIGRRYPVLFQVHDENVALADEDDADEALAFVKDVMATPPAWAPDLPVACEAKFATNYAEVK